jgi:hypothetical protein
MCLVCQGICDEIETIFGHKISPKTLEILIENSPLTTKKGGLIWHHSDKQ